VARITETNPVVVGIPQVSQPPLRRDSSDSVSRKPRQDRVGYLYVLPGFLFSLAFVLVPFLHAIVLSGFRWDGLSDAVWVGFLNYTNVLTEERLRVALTHSLYFIFFFSVLPVSIGLFLTALMSRRKVRGLTGFRTILFLPQILPMVMIGLTFRWIYNPNGMLNAALTAVGLDALTRPWLGSFTWALPAVGFVGTWAIYGLAMVLFMAGVQKIPTALYEAARIDGAGPVREFFAITLPGLKGELVVAVSVTLLISLRVFDVVWVMTQGGPGIATTVPSFEIYRAAFQTRSVGSAAAIGVIMAVFVVVVSLVATKLRPGRADA